MCPVLWRHERVGRREARGAERSSWNASWRRWHLSLVSEYSVEDSEESLFQWGEVVVESLGRVKWSVVLELSGVQRPGEAD